VSALFGGWRLARWSFVYDDGRPPEFPMGPDAQGYILYTPQGQVSAVIMRADKTRSFAYAGRFELEGESVVHVIEVATDPALVGFRNNRSIELAGDRLVLSGPDFTPGTGRTQRIEWERA
jgi:hypothetical protein